MEEKHKILEPNKKSEETVHILLILCAFGELYCDVVKRKRPCLLGCNKTQNPRIGTVLHWRPPDVYIFDTDQSSLVLTHYGSYNSVQVRE